MAKMLAPGMPMPEKYTIELDLIMVRNLAFLLQEEYGKWGSELEHHIKNESGYPHEVMELLDVIDSVRDQLTEQGIDWDPEL